MHLPIKKSLSIITASILIAASVGGAYAFKIKTVECTLKEQACDEVTTALANQLVNKPLLSLSAAEVETTLNQPLPNYRLLSVTKHLPGTVSLKLDYFSGGYAVRNQDQLIIINSEANILTEMTELAIPRFQVEVPAVVLATLLNQKQVDPVVHQHLLAASQVAERFSGEFQCQRISWDGQSTVICELPNGKRGVLSLENLPVDYERLVIVLRSLDLDTVDTQIKEVDARYRLPVLRTNSANPTST